MFTLLEEGSFLFSFFILTMSIKIFLKNLNLKTNYFLFLDYENQFNADSSFYV